MRTASRSSTRFADSHSTTPAARCSDEAPAAIQARHCDPIALACVAACAAAVDLPIVGMGGVSTGSDVLDLVAVGASAVALGTVLFADPWAARRIRSELREAGAEAPEAPHAARPSVTAAVTTSN